MMTVEQFNQKYRVGDSVMAHVFEGLRWCQIAAPAFKSEVHGEVFKAHYPGVQNALVKLEWLVPVEGKEVAI